MSNNDPGRVLSGTTCDFYETRPWLRIGSGQVKRTIVSSEYENLSDNVLQQRQERLTRYNEDRPREAPVHD